MKLTSLCRRHLSTRAFMLVVLIGVLGISQFTSATHAQTIWNGPRITASKAAGADPTLPENQDRITDNVWLTRGSIRGLYNIQAETSFINNFSPADTEWALGSTADIDSLSFTDFQSFVLGTVGSGNILQLLDQDIVLHLITDDIFVDFTLKEWGLGSGGGGSFRYERATAIPEPTTCALMGASLLLMATRRPRNRS